MVVKTPEDEGLISDLAETFNNLRKFKMKLNLISAPSAYLQANYSSIWSPVTVSTLTQRSGWLSQRCPEVDRVHGCLEQVHLTTRRQGTSIL
jgi:hypothetical protein